MVGFRPVSHRFEPPLEQTDLLGVFAIQTFAFHTWNSGVGKNLFALFSIPILPLSAYVVYVVYSLSFFFNRFNVIFLSRE